MRQPDLVYGRDSENYAEIQALRALFRSRCELESMFVSLSDHCLFLRGRRTYVCACAQIFFLGVCFSKAEEESGGENVRCVCQGGHKTGRKVHRIFFSVLHMHSERILLLYRIHSSFSSLLLVHFRFGTIGSSLCTDLHEINLLQSYSCIIMLLSCYICVVKRRRFT